MFASAIRCTSSFFLKGGKLPAEFGLGATFYSGEKFCLGVNYAASLWSEYYNDASGEKKGALKNASKISIGGYFRPDYKSFDNFFERVYYRYGAYYQTDPRVINNEQITSYGLTFGLGMPFVFQRKISCKFRTKPRGQRTKYPNIRKIC